jgi:hypothetical protein
MIGSIVKKKGSKQFNKSRRDADYPAGVADIGNGALRSAFYGLKTPARGFTGRATYKGALDRRIRMVLS